MGTGDSLQPEVFAKVWGGPSNYMGLREHSLEGLGRTAVTQDPTSLLCDLRQPT